MGSLQHQQHKKTKKAHNVFMRLSCIICSLNLIILGLCGGVFSLFSVNPLYFIFLKNITAMRIYLAISAVSALFLIYALITFKPFKGLK
jgi:hypothetical protein